MEPVERRRVAPKAREVKDIKLMTVGDAGVGKSALVRAFCEEANAQNAPRRCQVDAKLAGRVV